MWQRIEKAKIIEGKDYSFMDASKFVTKGHLTEKGNIINSVTKENINHIVGVWI